MINNNLYYKPLLLLLLAYISNFLTANSSINNKHHNFVNSKYNTSAGNKIVAKESTKPVSKKDFEKVIVLLQNEKIKNAVQLYKEAYNSWRSSFNSCADFVPMGNSNFFPLRRTIKIYDSLFTRIYSSAIAIPHNTKDNNTIATLLFYAGRSKYYIRNFRDAYHYLEKSLEYAKSSKQTDINLILNIYEATGDVYEEQRDYIIPLSYYYVCEKLTKQYFGETNSRMARLFEKKGGCFAHLSDERSLTSYMGSGVLETSIKYLRKSQLINKRINDTIEVAVNSFQIGLLYHYLGNNTGNTKFQDSARINALKAIDYLEKNDPGNLKLGNCYNVMKGYYTHKHQYDSALYFTKLTYGKHLRNRGKHHQMTIMAAQNLAGYFLNDFHNTDSALFYIQKAIEFSFPGYLPDSIYTYPDISYNIDFYMSFDAIIGKAEVLVFYGIENNIPEAIDYAFEILNKTEDYLSENRVPDFGLGFFNNEDNYYKTLKTTSECYMLCDSVFPHQGYRNKAFDYIEKLKYLQFIKNMSEEKLKAEAGIPERYIATEHEINNKILDLKNTFINRFISEKYKDLDETLKIQNEFINLTDSLKNINNYYTKNYPEYFRLLKTVNTVSLPELQHTLDKQTAIIDYFSFNYTLYAYVILRNDVKLFKTRISSNFDNKVDSLRQVILSGADSPESDEMYRKFVSLSRFFYQKLFTKQITEYISGIDRLIFLPEGVLYSLPYDVLLVNEPEKDSYSYKNLDYLIKNYSISVKYTAFMILNEFDDDVNYVYSYQGYAPEFNDKQLALLDIKNISPFTGTRSFGELKNNISEVEEVGDFFENSKLFLNDEAGEYKYKTFAPASEIIHLATHAQANVPNPLSSKLIFSLQDNDNFGEDNILNLYEIYRTPIIAKLVVLSACESNKGKMYSSEGIISLSRAFINAGAKSVISTNWWAHDETTKKIAVDFFKGVKNELPLDEALQNSKLNYLKNTDPFYAHPYYWANFVLIGNTDPIIENSNLWIIIMLVLISAGVFVISVLLMRRQG